jgi:hypothetical protein
MCMRLMRRKPPSWTERQVNYSLIGNVMTTWMWVSDEIKEIIFEANWLEQNILYVGLWKLNADIAHRGC